MCSTPGSCSHAPFPISLFALACINSAVYLASLCHLTMRLLSFAALLACTLGLAASQSASLNFEKTRTFSGTSSNDIIVTAKVYVGVLKFELTQTSGNNDIVMDVCQQGSDGSCDYSSGSTESSVCEQSLAMAVPLCARDRRSSDYDAAPSPSHIACADASCSLGVAYCGVSLACATPQALPARTCAWPCPLLCRYIFPG